MNYTICTSIKLRQLCIDNDWFDCGTNEEYDELFAMNRNGAHMHDMAELIKECSSCCSVFDILEELEKAHGEYLSYLSGEED